jgi:hypothetical protein
MTICSGGQTMNDSEKTMQALCNKFFTISI